LKDVDCKKVTKKKPQPQIRSKSGKVISYSIRQGVSKHSPELRVASSCILSREFGEYKRKLALRDETWRKRGKERKVEKDEDKERMTYTLHLWCRG